ncbi:MAG: futalosine hydrolase [Saprospiraceae bacterium]
MKILIVSATAFEIAPLHLKLKEHFSEEQPFQYKKNNLEISILITGVGMTATAFALGRILSGEITFDLVINLGIAGAFDQNLQLGEVVQVVSEQFGDLGVEEADGSFTDMFEMNLLQNDGAIFYENAIQNPNEDISFLKKVKAITVNKVHGYSESISKIEKKYQADIESMEGAAVFYACKLSEVKFLEIRAISNYVESRNRANWNIPLAIDSLNDVAWALLNAIKSED